MNIWRHSQQTSAGGTCRLTRLPPLVLSSVKRELVSAHVRPAGRPLEGHLLEQTRPPPNGAICQIQLLSSKMTCCRFKNGLLCAGVVTRARCDGALSRPVLVTTVVIRRSAGGAELIAKVAALPAEGTSPLQLPQPDNNVICPNNPENVFNLGALTACLRIWEPRRRSETSSRRSARSPSGFFSPPPEPGDHGAAETVDERQSAGIREEDKAESVKREAGL